MVLESNTLDVLFVKDGQQGEDGKVLYTWIKYAKDANGTGMTDDPNGAVYIGISYNNESSTESNDPTQYAWTKIQGADGKKGEDAYTIFLENENISFATDKNRNPLSEQAYTSGITIMKGAKPVKDFTIGDITKTQGIAVAKTDTSIAISVVNGNPLPSDSGEIVIPISVGGTVFKKILTWTCAKKGDQGEQGERGLQGIQGPQGIQGVAGKDGTNGKTTYFHIKYSSVANPTSSSQLTETPSTYIGTYVDFTETDSTDPKKYTWSQFVGSQGPKGEQGIAGVGVDGKTSYLHIAYANSADGKTGFSTSDSTNKSYIGQYTDFTPNDSTDYTKYSWSLIRGKDGTDGVSPTVSVTKNGKTTTITITDKNGTHTQTVKDGTDGTPGQTGKDGKTTYFHVKYSNDGGQTFTSNSGEDVGAYIGTCTDYNQADPTTVGAYTWARIKGEKGDQGVRGEKGKDGTSVTITNKSITYQLSTSGTTIPTGTWQTSPQTIPEGQYQWTKTSVTYSDGNKTESYSISYHGKNGSDGTSVKTTSTSVKYQVGDSGTTKPTGTWQSNVPTVAQGKYLWTQTIVNYSDGNSTESYSVSYRGIDGSNGVNGMNVATIYLYQRATSTPSKPSNTLTYTFSTTKITGTLNNGWSTAIQTGTDAVYVTVASVSSKNDTTTIATSAWSAPVVLAQNGKTGSDGKAGLNVATIYLYQRNTSKPSKPSASVTYTFSTGVASGLNNGWSQKIPDGTNPLYVTLATASSNTATDTILSSEWSDVVVMAQNGANGQDGISPKVSLSKSGNTTTISIVDATGTHTQTVKDGTNGTPGTAGKDGKTSYFHVKYSNDGGKTFTSNSGEDTGIYMGSYTDYTEADSTDVKKYNWVKVKGDKGDTGQKGQNAKNLSITPSSQYFKSTDGGKTFAPNTITIKPTIQGEISFGKWQYSIDGGVSFADIVSGQKGLTINNNVLTVSKDSSLYSDGVTMVTFRAVANDSSFYDTCSIAKIYDVSDIGDGRNLLTGVSSYTKDTPFEKTDSRADGWTMYQNIITSIELEAGKKYVLQAKTDGNWAANHDTNGQDPSKKLVTLWLCSDKTNNCFDMRQGYAVFTPTVTAKYKLRVNQYSNGTDAYTIHLWDIKLEKGSSPTGWTPAPEDLQTAILSTKSEISDVSIKVNNNKQAIEQRVEKTTYEQDLNLVKGNISKANEGLNKWRYEIYPKSLFTSEYQSKYTMDVFAKNKNLTPSQSVLLDDASLSTGMNYGDSHIAYGLTFIKMSAAKSITTTFYNDDGASFYVNGKQVISTGSNHTSGTSITFSLVQGWNCLEVVLNEGYGSEGFRFSQTLSKLSECQLMNCYYGTPVARQSHITNQLVENTTNIEGVTTTMQKVMTTVGGSDRIDEFVNNYNKTIESEKQFKKTIGETYTTKDEFNGLEIGGRNLLTKDDCNISKWQNLYPVHCKVTNNDYSNHIDYVPTIGEWEIVYKKISITKGQKYILSFDYKVNKAYNYLSEQKYGVYLSTSIPTSAAPINIITDGQYVIENTVTSLKRGVITFTAPIDTLYIVINGGCIDDNQTGLSFEFNKWKLEKGNKATDWTPAPEDNEINGQNLVSNLPSNWEQGGINGGQAVGSTYASIKSSTTYRIRIKDIFSVSGNIAVSAGGTTTNSAKETLSFYGTLYDAKKGLLRETGWKSFPSTINCGDAKYMSIILRWGDGTKTQITPPDISQICLKIERGTSATPFTLAPEDVNGKIVNVETIANQTADKFSWIVKSGTSASNFEITDKFMNLVSTNINLDGIVSFMNTAKGDGRKNLYNLDYSSFENVASQEDAICYAKDNGVTSVGIDSSVSYDGDKSLKISYTTANLNSSTTPLYLGSSTNNYGCVKIQAGKQYILSCYVKSDSTTGMFMIDIQGHDTPDTKTDGLYLSNIDPRRLPGSSTYVDLNTNWQRAVCAIKVADNATGLYWSVVPLIWGRPSSSSAPKTFNVWVDCIMLEEVDSISNEPGTYILDKETIIDGGSIKTDTITGNQILAGSITADKIATDAIKSRNYISSGGTQGSFLNLKDGSFTSPNLSWDANGNLIAKNANLSGEITATNGSIAGWTIISNKMYTTGSGKYTGIGKYGSAYAFWAGATSNDNGNSAVFKVGHTGKLTATDADITGTITATNGKIGRYDITSTYLMTNSGSNASGIGGNQAFWAGAEDSNSAPFRVGYDGVLWAENAAIRGNIETGNLGDEGDTVSIINGHIGIQGTSNDVEIYSTGFKFGIDGDYYLMSVSEGVKCYRNLYATDFIADGWVYCSEVHSSGSVVIGADSESFYWAHGYQMARGTSWGGVCIGDASQQLRLYGSSIWASHSISTSDENLKENFTTLDQYENFYMNLNPIGFNYIGDYDGKKTHFGFGAHKTEDVLESEGYDADKFAVVTHRPLVQEDIEKRFGKDVEVDIETEYGVSYTEFIALNTHMIQKTRRELTKVKQEKADLEVRLQAIEAKLGL